MDSDRQFEVLLRHATGLDESALASARSRAAELGISLSRAVVELGLATEDQSARALADGAGLEFVPAAELQALEGTPPGVAASLALAHRFAPLRIEDGVLVAAFTEPPSLSELGRLRLMVGLRIRPKICTQAALREFMSRHFGLGADTLRRIRGERAQITEEPRGQVFDVQGSDDSEAATIAHFVDQLLAEALRLRATDMHIEPFAGAVRLRYRVDGMLQDVPLPDGLRHHYPALVGRLKVMAELDITEKRTAHDGRITMRRGAAQYDLRVSIIPTPHGESVCLRFLGRQSLLMDLSQLGMEPSQRVLMEQLVRLPQGLALLTGPTGSGKTTTLYALLSQARDGRRKIITIEDPVEYQLEGVSQIQTRPEVGLDFAAGLRSVLRHDPDVILIGEIRDRETADAAMRAAQTGHLVFSTLHTNDSLGALTRLVDMGVEPWVIGSSLVCSVAQRLARRICPACAIPDDTIPPHLRAEMAEALGIQEAAITALRGRGCAACHGTGEHGRVALYEILRMTDELVDSLASGMRTVALRTLARSQGWRTLRENAWTKVQSGSIAVHELQRLTGRLELSQPGL